MSDDVYALPVVLIVPTLALFLMSRLSGWQRLADAYPGVHDPPRPIVRLGYGVFRGWMGYNGGIVVAVDERGLHLRAMPIVLSFCHAPISIPWSELREVRARPRLFGTDYALRTARAPEVDFAFRGSTFARLRPHVQRAGVPGDYAA